MDSNTIKLILSDYWAQISFILLGLGYLIKTIISITYKRKEINMSIFQKGKIDAVNHFLDIYSVTKSTINTLPEYDIYDRKISANGIDNIIQPMKLNLYRVNNEIRIYFDSDIFSAFNQIITNIEKIDSKLQNIYFDPRGKEYSSTNKSIDFLGIKTVCFEENEKILSMVLNKIRKDFGWK